MDIPLDVQVHCTDGRCGRSTHVILDPTKDRVTHIVVKERRPSTMERMVPVELILNTAAEVILLDCTKVNFAHLPAFQQTDFVYTEIPQYATDPKLTAIWPYVVPVKRLVDDTFKRVAPGELAVRRGAQVRATDGRVGRVDEFIVGPESGHITHILMVEGHLWGKKEVCIPVSHVEKIEENVVQLNIDKEAVEEMPAVPVRRGWR